MLISPTFIIRFPLYFACMNQQYVKMCVPNFKQFGSPKRDISRSASRRNKKRRFKAANSVRTAHVLLQNRPTSVTSCQASSRDRLVRAYAAWMHRFLFLLDSNRNISRLELPNCLKFGRPIFTYCTFIALQNFIEIGQNIIQPHNIMEIG